MATALYTPEVLALATGLSAYRLDDGFVWRGDARSRSCGSSLTLGLELDPHDRVTRVGLRSQACAIGQASAAIFAQSVSGRSAEDIAEVARGMTQWLAGEGALPEWPGLTTIVPARDYPGRHGALMLPWTAVLQLLSTRAAAG
jgi:NifU-like protein involved in Fe-S cluster formation